jgi:hypothetical protein
MIQQLVQAQQEFDALMADRTSVQNNEEMPTVTAQRPLLERLLQLLVDSLRAWQLIDPSPEVDVVMAQLHDIILECTAPVVAEHTRKANDAKHNPPPPDSQVA